MTVLTLVRMFKATLCSLTLLGCTALRASAQCTPDPTTGVGRVTLRVALPPITGLHSHRGCVALGSEVFVLGQDPNAGSIDDPWTIAAYDVSSGTARQVKSYPPDLDVCALVTDGSVLIVAGISPAGPLAVTFLDFVDTNGNSVSTVRAANGAQPVAFSTIGLAMGTMGLAYDPNGNGGNGSLLRLVHGIGQAPRVVETPLAGATLPEPAVNGIGSSPGGFHYDPISDLTWIGQGGEWIALSRDPSTGYAPARPRICAAVAQSPGETLGLTAIHGGLDVRNGAPRGRGQDLVAVENDGTNNGDWLIGYRLDLVDGYSFTNEPELRVGVDNSTASAGIVSVPTTASQILVDLEDPRPYLLFFNLEPESLASRSIGPLAPGIFPEFWELRRLTPFTQPAAAVSLQASGVGGAPLVLPVASVLNAVGGAPHTLRVQAIYLDPAVPGLGVMTTNEAGWGF